MSENINFPFFIHNAVYLNIIIHYHKHYKTHLSQPGLNDILILKHNLPLFSTQSRLVKINTHLSVQQGRGLKSS